jgi:hypothetical protein
MIVHGIKTVENRTWSTQYRGPIAICASSSIPDPELVEEEREWCRKNGIAFPSSLPVGGIVGIVDLVGIFGPARPEDEPDFFLDEQGYILFGDDDVLPTGDDLDWYADGSVGWLLANPRITDFVRIKGQLGLYEINFPVSVHEKERR